MLRSIQIKKLIFQKIVVLKKIEDLSIGVRMPNTHITANHKIIRQWVEARGGVPVRVLETETPTEEEGVLDFLFDGKKDKRYKILSWSEFFKRFEQSHLAFEYEESLEGKIESKFYKFISRNGE